MPGTSKRPSLTELGVTTAQITQPGGLLGDLGRLVDRIPGLFLGPGAVTVVRPRDLLCLRFSFVNATVRSVDGGPVLQRFGAGRPARIVVDFPPQSVTERAFLQDSTGHEPTSRPVRTMLSGHSRVVLDLADTQVPFTLEGLLDALRTLPLVVAPHAEDPPLILDPIVVDVANVAGPAIGRLVDEVSAPTIVAHSLTRQRVQATAARLEQRFGAVEARATVGALAEAHPLGLDQIVVGPADLGIDVSAISVRRRRAPQAPTSTQTALEVPWRLILSPNSAGRFAHAADPVERDGRVELWHSRLTAPRVRAIWARDFDYFPDAAQADAKGDFPSTDSPAWTKALSATKRMKIVHESSNQTLRRGALPWNPVPVEVDHLLLTTLGAWLRSHWEVDKLPGGEVNVNLLEWKHRATMGRDHYVKVVEAGFLYPFGHLAALVTVTERRFATDEPGSPAYLFQRQFITVLEHTKTYTSNLTHPDMRPYLSAEDQHAKRLDLSMPFASVTVVTGSTPDLSKGGDLRPGGAVSFTGEFTDNRVFFPHVAGTPFPFAIVATDREGHQVEYAGPLLWMSSVSNKLSGSASIPSLGEVTERYWRTDPKYRRHPLGGARVAYAPSVAPDGTPLDTVVETQAVQFDAAVDARLGSDLPEVPKFAPLLREAEIVSPAVNVLAKQAAPVRVKVPAHYAAQGLASNAANVFLQSLEPPALDFTSQADRSGGFVTPNMKVTGFSGSTGPIGCAVDKAASGSLTPADFFGSIPAKLFGAVSLVDLIEAIAPGDFPAFVADSLDQIAAFQKDLARITELAQTLTARADAAQAQEQAAADAVENVATAAAAVVAAIGGWTPGADLSGPVSALAASLTGVAEAVDAATTLPTAIRAEASSVVRRLAGQVADAAGLLALMEQVLGGLALPETLRARLTWSTPLQPAPAGLPIFQPVPKPGQTPAQARSTLDLVVEMAAPVTSGGEPAATVACSISPFRLQLVGNDPWIALNIEKIALSMAAGKKVEVDVVFAEEDGIEFGGPLSFVNTLRDFIPFDGFSDPPYLDVDTSGIRAGFDLELPPITVGVMSLTRVSLGAEARVPFIGESLDFSFSFCRRERPFLLTVWLFGGGGFFTITVDPSGCKSLEAGFEFGAAVALDFGVASGSIECMAGIYFRLEKGNSQLTGYFRLRGEVDVLGLISASIELYLELSYNEGKAIGRATLTIEVEVLFFSASVELECEKKFKGSNQDPAFALVMGPAEDNPHRPWDDYCLAFTG